MPSCTLLASSGLHTGDLGVNDVLSDDITSAVGNVTGNDLSLHDLGQISADHRTALVETCLRGRSYQDVAAELDVPQTTLRSKVFLGLKAMRPAIDQMGVRA